MIEREEDLSKKADVIQQCTELTDTEFEYIVGYLIGWIKGNVNTRCEYSRPEKPFYRIIPASLTIYGYLESFFCSHFEDSDSFDARVSELKELIPSKTEPPTESNERIAEVMALIRQAKLESTDH